LTREFESPVPPANPWLEATHTVGEQDQTLPPLPPCVLLSPRPEHSVNSFTTDHDTLPSSQQNQPSHQADDRSPDEKGCPKCSLKFRRQCDLNSHLKTHDIYVCPICDTHLRYSKDFAKDKKRHEESKTHQRKLGGKGSMKYTCPVVWCSKGMLRKENLNRHIKSQHPGQPLL
jgi:uncharacterized C2H2 Zn-finger protein